MRSAVPALHMHMPPKHHNIMSVRTVATPQFRTRRYRKSTLKNQSEKNMSQALPAKLLAHLDRIAKAQRFGSYSVHHEAGSKHGDGFMGDIIAVKLSGQRRAITTGGIASSETLPLICKLLPKSTIRQEQFQCKVIFEREVHIYSHIMPMLRQFQADKGLTEANGFFGYPRCYAAVADEATNDYAIIMDDLRAHGYSLWDKFTPMPIENARLLFEQLGRVHGLSLVLRAQRPDLHASIVRLDDKLCPLLERMRPMCESALDQAVRHLERPEHKRIMQTVRDNWMEILKQCVNSEAAEPFAVLGHGDCWNNNMMFAGKSKICLLDWQIARYVSPAVDLVYFLCSSTDKSLRDQHYDQLLLVYHENLCNIGRACGIETDLLLTFKQLQQQLREFGKYGVLMAPVLLQVIVSEASNILDMDEMAKTMSRPDYDASTEVEVTKFDAVSLAKYRQRMGDVVDDAQRLGWI